MAGEGGDAAGEAYKFLAPLFGFMGCAAAMIFTGASINQSINQSMVQ